MCWPILSTRCFVKCRGQRSNWFQRMNSGKGQGLARASLWSQLKEKAGNQTMILLAISQQRIKVRRLGRVLFWITLPMAVSICSKSVVPYRVRFFWTSRFTRLSSPSSSRWTLDRATLSAKEQKIWSYCLWVKRVSLRWKSHGKRCRYLVKRATMIREIRSLISFRHRTR